MKEKKYKKLIKKIVYFIIYVILITILSIVIIQKFSNNNISFLGYRIFRVVSESMVPEYNINDVLLIKKIKNDDIETGNNISYKKTIGENKEVIITHKVIDIEKDSDGNIIFHTKGLANTIEDPIVKEEQVYGVVIHKIYLLSILNKLINNKYGFLILVIAPLFILVCSNIKELIKLTKEKEDEK